MHKTSKYENVLLVTITIALVVVIVTLLNTSINIELSLKTDTFIIVCGNIFIAYYITVLINKKHKNEEQKVANCFKELDYLLEQLSSLRTEIEKDNVKFQNKFRGSSSDLDDFIIRFDSLVSLQIALITKYNFIKTQYKDTLSDEYYKLNKSLTDDNKINTDYKISLLRIEETILNIKSDIL